ncbi:hypothetical protein [Methylobacterium sp. Leaf399]|uniref:hypothetical protein n=1 Tax=Methylobacterium sp. Leaf399 TaxID=1736364 RepID=UPI000A44E54D|nr:hypothetical protein [Methylobacterium sp. Leaf399]
MRRVFAIPALVALLTVAGLLSALLFEEAGPPISWLALGVPLLLLAWHLLRFARRRRPG